MRRMRIESRKKEVDRGKDQKRTPLNPRSSKVRPIQSKPLRSKKTEKQRKRKIKAT